MRPLISQQPGWSLLQKRRLHPCHATRVTSEQVRGARSIRGRARGSYSIATVGGPPHPPTKAPRPPETTVFGETAAKGGSAHQPQKARPAARGARHEGSEAGSRPSPRPKTPRMRVRCPEGPSIKGPHRIGQSMFPGRPGTRVGRRKPWLRRQAQPRPTLPTQRRSSNDPSGARVRGSVADVETKHLPPGARPAERQATTRGVTFCGGLLGDDEGPIRSGRKGARLERAN